MRLNKTTEETVAEALGKIEAKKSRHKITPEEIAEISAPSDTRIVRNASGHFLLDKEGQPIAGAKTRKEIIKEQGRLSDEKLGIRRGNPNILNK